MSTIPADRQIHTKLSIGRTDGSTWSDLTDCLARARIELGDVTGLGAEGSGGDMPVRRMTMTLRNDGAPLSPHIQGSSWNQFNGSYSPLLWPMREVLLDVAATVPGTAPQSGDWVRLFHGYLGDSIQVDGDSVTCDCRDLAKRLQNAYIETVREYGSKAGVAAETVIQSILNDNLGSGVVTLYTPTSPGFMLHPYRVEYQSVWDAIQQIAAQIGWWLGYRWDAGTSQFRLTFMAPPRTTNLIDLASWDPVRDNQYETITKTPMTLSGQPVYKCVKKTQDRPPVDLATADIPAGDTCVATIWSKMDAAPKTGPPTLLFYKSGILAQTDSVLVGQWERLRVTYTNNTGATLAGVGIYFYPAQAAEDVTYFAYPQAEEQHTTVWSLTAADDIYAQPLDISDADIRNVVAVTYKDRALGKRQTVTVSDAVSILEYGRRAMGIEERDASLIDTSAEAQALAQAAVDDLRDMTGTTRIVMPLMPRLELFHGVVVQNPLVSDQDDFYGVDSVMHDLDFEAGRFRTEVIASRRVVGARTRWLAMQTRPGGTVPITGGDVIGGQAPATLVVAASDSSWRGRESADYVCDGTSDQVQINDALNWLVSDGRAGGRVMLLEGTYYILNTIELPANVTLEGQGPSTIITFPCSGNPASNAMIRGVGVYGSPAPNIRVAHLTVDGGAPTHEWSVAVGLPDAPDAIVEGITCINAHDGIVASNSPRARIQNCVVRDVSGLGVFASGDGAIVSGCVVATCDVGIRLMGASSMVATGNTCRTCTYGIQLQAAIATTVSANACELSGRDGIWVSDSDESQIIGNAITASSQESDSTYAGIFVRLTSSRNNIQHNIVRMGSEAAAPKYGIWIDSNCDRNLVTNNDLYQAGKTAEFKNDGTNTVTTAGNRT